MSNNAQNVSFGKPKATGAVYVAPKGTTLPTNATSSLDAAFKNMGYISDDGLVDGVKTNTSTVNAWGGAQVLVGQDTFGEMFTVKLLETQVDALKVYYGNGNVTVDGSGNITIVMSSAELDECVVVFETVMTGGRLRRLVVPHAKIVDRSGDITFRDKDPVMYPAVFVALPDTNGNTHTEYIAVAAS